MRRAWLALLFLCLPTESASRPIPGTEPPLVIDARADSEIRSTLTSLSSHVFTDTVVYGGTYWAGDSLRWEALRDSHWSFDSGVGSSFGPTGPNKPAGYHTRMEGWFGIDQTIVDHPFFRRSTTCAINGSYSMWAGISQHEADSACYVAGQGYGNSWDLLITKTFTYPGSGNVTLSYKYAVDAEPFFDFTYTEIDTGGTGDYDEIIPLVTYNGIQSGTATINLVRGVTLPFGNRPVTIRFSVVSDGSYSDEDGLYTTSCGHTAIDDISLSGAITDFSNFESGANGWTLVRQTTGVGEFSNIVSRSIDLPPPATFCACSVRDSVLVFYDLLGGHPLDQDNIAVSPWIDLKRGGDVGRAGKIMLFDIYAELPISQVIFVQMRTRWYPDTCPENGLIRTSPFRDENVVFYYGEAPFCTPPGAPRQRDFSRVIPPYAEQVQVAFGVINLCRTIPFGMICTGLSNTTPWFDNVGLGVYSSPHAGGPVLTVSIAEMLQDSFATDGTLNPAATGRIDMSRARSWGGPGGYELGDSLTVRTQFLSATGPELEVRIVFRVHPGPFTSSLAYNVWATQWSPEPSLGSGWFTARMDTTERGGSRSSDSWMGTFHELDPAFTDNDRASDPADPDELLNEIFPDHILTPGSRIDYFVKARYLPPDPRNPTGTIWSILPDTSGGRFFEMEVLPSSMATDTTWNCTLYVDHHADTDPSGRRLEELALTAALGIGGVGAEGTRFDRWDARGTNQFNIASLGRPFPGNFGASLNQAFGYRNIVWHSSAGTTNEVSAHDASLLTSWLTFGGTGRHAFWGSGDGLVTAMNASTSPTVQGFMRNVLGVTRVCDTVRNAACPAGAALDSTFCLPLVDVAGAEFSAGFGTSVRGNGCPDVRSFDVIARSATAPSSRGQVSYSKNGMATDFASVTNVVSGESDYRTIIDGFALGQVRATPSNPHSPLLCAGSSGAVQRTVAILNWFGNPGGCTTAGAVTGIPFEPALLPTRSSLGIARPNPMSRNAVIAFTNRSEKGHVALQVFDVTGRLVRTLVDADLPAGAQEVAWDATSDSGEKIPNGLYFFKMTADGGHYTASRKLLVLRQ